MAKPIDVASASGSVAKAWKNAIVAATPMTPRRNVQAWGGWVRSRRRPPARDRKIVIGTNANRLRKNSSCGTGWSAASHLTSAFMIANSEIASTAKTMPRARPAVFRVDARAAGATRAGAEADFGEAAKRDIFRGLLVLDGYAR